MLELTSGPIVPTFPANAGSSTFLNMLGTVHIVKSSNLPIALETVAPVYCADCGIYVSPVPLSDPLQGWVSHPCHEQECGSCYVAEELCDCGYCSGCCDCVTCGSCGSKCEDAVCDSCDYCESCCECSSCDYCGSVYSQFAYSKWCEHSDHSENGEMCCAQCCAGHRCDCGYCSNCYSKDAVIPGWVRRGDSLPSALPQVTAKSEMAEWVTRIDPAMAMADFYVADFAIAMIPNYVTVNNQGWRDAAILRSDAKRLQDAIVAMCDEAFQTYVFLAIGGEERHHRGVRNSTGALPSGRADSWDYWLAMGDAIGRETLTRDAVEIFGCATWSNAYGGHKWQVAAQTLLHRLDGTIDARTFVDRVFSLQHNGGSLLNKSRWVNVNASRFGTEEMKAVGDAHAASHPDFLTLLQTASSDAREIASRLLGQSWVFKSDFSKVDYRNLQDATEYVANARKRPAQPALSNQVWGMFLAAFTRADSIATDQPVGAMSPQEIATKNLCHLPCKVCEEASALSGWVSEEDAD